MSKQSIWVSTTLVFSMVVVAGCSESGLVTAPDGGVTCQYAGKTYPVGASVKDSNDCNTCYCGSDGRMGCTLTLCLRDAGALGGNDAADDAVNAPASCALPAPLTFGPNGGMVRYQDEYTLDPHAGMSITRTYYGLADIDGAAVRTCTPALPVCGASGLVSLANIVADLSATDVQAAFGNAPNTVYGRDDRPVDGTVYSIRYAEHGPILVGAPCTGSGSTGCLAIPVGVQRLADDLRSLASAAIVNAECKNL